MTSPLLVAAAALMNDQNQVLIAKRPHDVEQGGLWEFPGGKLAPYETGFQALKREIYEELGVTIKRARPLIRVQHYYAPDKRVLLDVWKVQDFSGEPWGREGQPVRWVALDDLPDYTFPAANQPIINALCLPEELLITGSCPDADKAVARLERALERGVRLVQLRDPGLDAESYRQLARRFSEACQKAGAKLLLNAPVELLQEPVELLQEIQAAGLHLTQERLMQLKKRPVDASFWLSAACHDAVSLHQAQALGVDFVTLSPVQSTPSHPERQPLGWQGFKELVEYEAQLPVYALGGMHPEDRQKVFALGAQGVAGISHFW